MDTGAASTTLVKDRNCATDDDLSMLRKFQASLGPDRVKVYTYVLRHIEKYDKFCSHLKEIGNLCSSIDRLLDGDDIPSSDESGKRNTTLEDVMIESKTFRESLGEELVKCFTYVHSEEEEFNQYRIRYSAVVRLRNSLTDSNKTVDACPKLTLPTPLARDMPSSVGAKTVSKEGKTNASETVVMKEGPDRTGPMTLVARVLGPAPVKQHISDVLLVRNPMKVSVAPNTSIESTNWNTNALVKDCAKLERNQDVPRFVGSEMSKTKPFRDEGKQEDDRESTLETFDGEESNDHPIVRDRSTDLSNQMTKRQKLIHQRAIATKGDVMVEKVKTKPNRSAGDQEDLQDSASKPSDELESDDRDGKFERQKPSRGMYRPTIGEKVKAKHNRSAGAQDSASESSDESKSDNRSTNGGRTAGKNGGQRTARGMYKPTIATKREAMAEKQKTIYWRESVGLSPIDFESKCTLFTRKYPKIVKSILTANKLAARKPVTLTIGIIRHCRKAYSVCAFCERDIDMKGDSMQAYDVDKCRRHRFHRDCGAYARMVCPDRCLGCIIDADR